MISQLWWVAGGLGAFFLIRKFERASVFRPTRRVEQDPSSVGLEFEPVSFMTEDAVVLEGWWVPHPEATGTILYCHGNAYNIGDRIPLVQFLHGLKQNVFLFDYRGYGNSRGRPSEAGLYRDARAAYEVVRARYDDVEDPPVVVYGCSLGGAVAVHLASERKARALIVESTFTSIQEMAKWQYPRVPFFSKLLWYRFDNLRNIRHVRVPLFISHSRGDEIIPYEMGRRVFEAAPEPKQFFETSGMHSENSWDTTPGYRDALLAFLRRHLP